jgi:Zn-finger nucleic acid-binding protein
MLCPKCHGPMQTYSRSGIHIEQCGNCRGVFLDYGELEALTRLEGQWSQPAPPSQPYPGQQAHAPQPHAPAWGAPHHGGHHGHNKHHSFVHMLFSS